MRSLASVKCISAIDPIDGADNILVASIDGWKAVIGRSNGYSVGQLVVYCEIDSVLPTTNPEFSFMEKYNYRVKTIRLRKQVSQGITFPLSILPEGDWKEGDDVTELLGIVKYEPPEDNSGGCGARLGGNTRGSFPSFLVKSDETRVQGGHGLLNRIQGLKAYSTIKCDGSSFTAYLFEGKFGVCSRNQEKKYDPENAESDAFCNIAKKLDIEKKLSQYVFDTGVDGIAIQGELVGPGIQKNRMKLAEHELFIYNLFFIKGRKYANGRELESFCNKYGLKMVPVVDWNHEFHTDVQKYVNDSDGLKHESYNGEQVEGLVYRPLEEFEDHKFGRVSFKAINNSFLLKHGE